MNKRQKITLTRIIVTAIMLVSFHFVPISGWPRFLMYLIPYLIVGYDILIKAFKGILNRQVFDENFLMAIATLGAISVALYRSGDYTEAIAVMFFYQIGEFFQSYAVGKSRRNISELMDIRPDYANIEEEGQLKKVDPYDVEVGTIIIVQPGEKVPLDGIVVEGKASLNTSALTGESIPRDVSEGSEIISGCINLDGVLKIKTTKEFDDSTVSKILDMVENASFRKAKSENFISKFAKVYTPAVCISAIALAIVPPLVRMNFMDLPADWPDWIYRALTFLVISCPCALVISIPLSFFAGIGGASKEGILVKGANYLEMLSKTKYVVFDKTGTLTHGVFEVNAVHHNRMKEEELIEYAALVESSSSHPISKSLQEAYGKAIDRTRVSDTKEISGQGITAKVDGKDVAVGNDKLMESMGVEYIACSSAGTIIHIAIDGVYEGHIIISDVIKDESKEAIEALKRAGIKKTIMLTGDRDKVAQKVGQELGIDLIHSELLPQDKMTELERLLSTKGEKHAIAFVGDGINDAPVLSRADVGIAMGAMGSDAAIEAADVVLMDDNPMKISKAIRIFRKCMRIVHQNIVFAIGVKLTVLLLGALGFASMWLAIFADVGVMIIAVLNAMRALFVKNV